MDILEAIRGRRSIRAYEPRRVPRATIEAVILDAAHAPPPFRDQAPWTFQVLDDPDRVQRLGARAMAYARTHRPDGPGFAWLDWPEFRVFWDAPAVIVISGPVQDCCRAGQTLMQAALARGLGTCWVGAPMPWLASDDGRAELGLAPGLTPAAAFCLGYPRETPVPPPRGRPAIVWCDPA